MKKCVGIKLMKLTCKGYIAFTKMLIEKSKERRNHNPQALSTTKWVHIFQNAASLTETKKRELFL